MEEQHHREQMTRLTSQILLVYIGVYMVVMFTRGLHWCLQGCDVYKGAVSFAARLGGLRDV